MGTGLTTPVPSAAPSQAWAPFTTTASARGSGVAPPTGPWPSSTAQADGFSAGQQVYAPPRAPFATPADNYPTVYAQSRHPYANPADIPAPGQTATPAASGTPVDGYS